MFRMCTVSVLGLYSQDKVVTKIFCKYGSKTVLGSLMEYMDKCYSVC